MNKRWAVALTALAVILFYASCWFLDGFEPYGPWWVAPTGIFLMLGTAAAVVGSFVAWMYVVSER